MLNTPIWVQKKSLDSNDSFVQLMANNISLDTTICCDDL